MEDSTRTSATLLNQLNDPDAVTREAAWKTVYEKYESRLAVWAGETGASKNEVDELIHLTWVAIWKGRESFSYDPAMSFRAYLKTVIRRKASKFLKQRFRESELQSEAFATMEDQNLRAVDHAIADAEKEIALMEIRDRIQDEVNSRDWLIWEARQLKNEAVDDVAQAHQVSLDNVYKIVSRINKTIQRELAKLNENDV